MLAPVPFMKIGRIRAWPLIVLLIFLPGTTSASASSTALAHTFVDNGGFQVDDGSHLKYRANERFIPASVLKTATALLALEILGPDFRFTTHLYLDHEKNLYIQGRGDPFLTSETVLDLCRHFQQENPGVKSINTLFLDTSLYALNGRQISIDHSDNPYDAPNGALAVNFNTLPIFVKKNGAIRSGEQQTPTLPIMRHKAKLLHLSPGTHRINVTFKEHGSDTMPLLYAGELFKAQLKTCGIDVRGELRKKRVPPRLQPVLVYQNPKPLKEMLRLLLHHSNNFIANQIFLQLSLQRQKEEKQPASWQKSRRLAALFFQQELGLSARDLIMVEGSGLSLDNRITCRAGITILKRFRPWASLLRQQRNILVKSGTMPKSGIFSYAGYFKKRGRLIPYILLLNQRKNTRKPLLQKLERLTH